MDGAKPVTDTLEYRKVSSSEVSCAGRSSAVRSSGPRSNNDHGRSSRKGR